MKKLFFILLLITGVCSSQNFLKYSTFYTSGTIGSSTLEDGMFKIEDKELIDITEVNPYDYNFTVGLRKVARFDYEHKVKSFYDGTESTMANKAPIGNAKGFEYLANISFIRDRGEEYINQDFFLRYLSDSYLFKAQFVDNQRVELKYILSELKWRKNVGNWDFMVGGVFGYVSEQWVQGTYVNYDWFDISSGDSVMVAHTTGEFMQYHFGNAIDDFNDSELEKLGLQKELSVTLGAAYYKWTPKWWLHGWMNILPYHVGLDDYSFDYTLPQWEEDPIPAVIEWDTGLVLGVRLTKSLGLFVEGSHQRYWMKPVQEIKIGINYLFL